MLYWAEGAKTHNGALAFVNSDALMLQVFAKFLRDEMQIDDSIIRFRLTTHESDLQKIQKIEQYWLDLLEIPSQNLRRGQIKKGNDQVKHNIYPNGFAILAVYRIELFHHVLGAIQEYGGFENPDWLF
jgi:hypothetical protein